MAEIQIANKKYERCMVFAGGGTRFGIYLGMYAAACDVGRPPDLLLASCGGALAATIIQALPDDAQRLAWLSSPQMYEYWRSMRPSSKSKVGRVLWRAAARLVVRARAPVVPNLFKDYMFDHPPLLPLPTTTAPPKVAVAIVGGRLLFGPNDVGQQRGKRKLFEQTVFGEARTAALLEGMKSPFSDPVWGSHAIADTVRANMSMPLLNAARISITDFYYFSPIRHRADQYIGGLVDLFPIEVAHRLANEVVMEFKQSFDQSLAIPAWRTVLGLNGNQRLRHVNAQVADVWVDTSDLSRALARQQVRKRLDLRHNRIALHLPRDHATYARYMEDQWQYGYQRAMEAFNRPAPEDKSTMRQVNRFNRAVPCVS